MRVVKPRTIQEYGVKHPDARAWLEDWLEKTVAASWDSIADVRRVYPHADAITVASGQTVTVFNVKGNRYRLIVAIKYQWGMVYVLRLLTHGEYDSGRWKDRL